MKILARKNNNTYIAEVSHSEIEQFMDLYYNKMNRLSEGQEIDLGKGYDFHRETKKALKATEEFISSNREIVNAILNGFSVLGSKSESPSSNVKEEVSDG